MKRDQQLFRLIDLLATNRKLQSKDIEARLMRELTRLAEELIK